MVEWEALVEDTRERVLSMMEESLCPRVLFVDDDAQILRVVQRLLEDAAIELITCDSGEQGMRILAEQEIAVLISDQRMPGMSGAELLQFAAKHYPETVRIMLTGNNDVHTAMEAINRGSVFRFVTKPWDRQPFMDLLQSALEQHELLTAKRRYERYVERQNRALQELNQELELRVNQRTAELSAKQDEVVSLYQELQRSFDATIRVLLSIMELADIHVVEHCQRTAARAGAMAEALKMEPRQRRDLERAARLHWLGLINAPTTLFEKEIEDFDAVEMASWEFHPLLGQQAIQHVPELAEPGKLILHYLRRYDDRSFRVGADLDDGGRLTAELIRSCRVLAICSAFECWRSRAGGRRGERIDGPQDGVEEGIARVVMESGRRFDPELVSVFIELASRDLSSKESREVALDLEEVRAGMVLSRPLQTAQGVSVAPRDIVVTEELVERLRRFGAARALSKIHVWL